MENQYTCALSRDTTKYTDFAFSSEINASSPFPSKLGIEDPTSCGNLVMNTDIRERNVELNSRMLEEGVKISDILTLRTSDRLSMLFNGTEFQ